MSSDATESPVPERLRVRRELAGEILGHGIYWSYDLARPDGAQDALDEADRRYVAVVEEVNWSRIMQEAYTRCIKMGHREAGDDYWMPNVCGQCVKDELLTTKTTERGGGW
jgi:hypothetical protein